MALRKKQRSRPLETAEYRLNALLNIDENIEFGAGFSTESYNALVEEAKQQLHEYNSMIANVDQKRDVVRRLERELNDANERIFSVIIGLYGRDSIEYEMIGGTRKSNVYNSSNPYITHSAVGSADGSEGETGEGET